MTSLFQLWCHAVNYAQIWIWLMSCSQRCPNMEMTDVMQSTTPKYGVLRPNMECYAQIWRGLMSWGQQRPNIECFSQIWTCLTSCSQRCPNMEYRADIFGHAQIWSVYGKRFPRTTKRRRVLLVGTRWYQYFWAFIIANVVRVTEERITCLDVLVNLPN